MAREWITDFLASLTLTPNVSEACRQAGVTRQAAYKLRASDPEFAALWDDALDESTDELVAECYRRAKAGSDTLAIFLLKAHRRHVYGDQAKVLAEHSGPGGGPIPIGVDVAKLTDEQLRAIVAGAGGG